MILRVGNAPVFNEGMTMLDVVWKPESDPGWIVDREIMDQDSESTYRLKGFECAAKTAKEWSEHFCVPQLHKGWAIVKKTFDEPGMWESKRQALNLQKSRLTK